MRRTLLVVFALGIAVTFTACGGCDGDTHDMTPDAAMPDGEPPGPDETVCENLPALAGGTCSVGTGNDSKLIKGNILTPTGVFRGGQVLIDATGLIKCVGCNCAQGGETTITCPAASVSPGLINTHDHITFTQNDPYTPPTANGVLVRYEHRHQWRKGQDGKPKIPAAGGASGVRISWGELRFLMGGATSIVGSGGQAGLLRNLDNKTGEEGLNHPAVDFDTFPLGDSSGTRRTADCDYGGTVTPDSLMSFKSFEPHTAEGTDASANNEFKCESSPPTGPDSYDSTGAPKVSQNLLMPKTAMIHAVGLTAANYGAMALAGTSLIWSPRSNITLYGDTARVTTAKALGVNIALGTDWMPTGSMNLLRELRCADELNDKYLGGAFTDKELWEMVTINAAVVTATDDAIGQLAVDHVADITIFAKNGKPHYRAVLEAEPKDVALVLRGGVPLYGEDATVGALAQMCDTVDVCGNPKRVCLQKEVGKSYTDLQAAVGDIYPAFECGPPTNEPTCVPQRQGPTNSAPNYSGVIVAGSDSDGDGIMDPADNCPKVFNPIRAVDAGKQGDLDGDGTGDECDVCPNDPGTTTCTSVNPDDRDHDGFVNTADNCPDDANPGQEDTDGDKKGDACDACPMDANSGTSGCPSTIYKVKNGTTPAGSVVRIDNALVTGKGTNGFFVQTKSGDAGYMGSDYSGIFVYTGAMAPALASAVPGYRVSIDATVTLFNGQIELDQVSTVLPTTMSFESSPTPVDVTYTEVKTGGTRAATLESVIVSLASSATVTAVDTMFGEFTLTSGADTLVVDDFLFATPNITVSQTMPSIRGILALRQMASKLEPRTGADIGTGVNTLATFGPALSYVRQGQVNVNTYPAGMELTVTLSSVAAADTDVAVTSGNAAITVANNKVTVLQGQASAKVVLTGVTQNADVTLTAQLGGGSPLTAHVRVLGLTEAPSAVTCSPSAAVVAPNGTVTLTATLDIPAPSAGSSVTLGVTPGASGTTNPASTLPIAGNTLSSTFSYTDAAGSGSANVTTQLGAGSPSTCTVTVASGSTHLVINEVDYDQLNTDAAEYIEIYNPTSSPISLANIGVVLVNGATGSVSAYPTADSIIDLSPLGSVPGGGYIVLAGANIAPAPGALKLDPGWTTNQIQNGSPDGIALVDTQNQVLIDALSYEGPITSVDVPGISTPVSLVEGTALSAGVFDGNVDGQSLCRSPNGKDTDNANSDWKLCTTLTPGSANP